MSIHFDYTIDINKAIDNLDKVKNKVIENVNNINKVSNNINYSDNASKSFQEAQGIVAQLKNSMLDTGKISWQELNFLQDKLIVASDKLRDVEYENTKILNELKQGLGKVQISKNSKDAVYATSSKISSYQRYISIHKQLSKEANKLGNELDKLQDDINKVSSSLDKQEQSTNKTKNISVSFIAQLRRMKQELFQMKLAGDTSSEAYKKLSAEIMKFEGARKGATNGLDPLSTFKGIISGMTALSGVTTAAAGALSLFGEKNEAIQKITMKLNALMSITIGLQQIEQTLLKSSAFQVNVVAKIKQWYNNLVHQEAILTRALSIARAKETTAIASQTTAQNIQTAASKKLVLANTMLAGSFKKISLAIKSIPGIGWILAITGAIISAVTIIGNKRKKAVEDAKRQNEDAKRQSEEYAQIVGSNAGKVLIKYGELQNAYKKLSNTTQKNAWIKQHQQDFNDLGIAINNVTDADNAFIKNNDKVIASIMARAKASAYQNLLQKKYEEYAAYQVSNERIANRSAIYNDIERHKPTSQKEYEALNGSNQNPIYLDALEKKIDKADKKEQKLLGDINALKEGIISSNAELQKTLDEAGLTPSSENTAQEKNKELEKLKKNQEEYKKLLAQFRKSGRNAEISLIEDDMKRQLAEEEERFNEEKNKLDKELLDLKNKANSSKENVPNDIDEIYNTRKEALEYVHSKKIFKIHNEANEKYKQELESLLNTYSDYNEKRLAIDRKYNDDLEKLQKLRKQAEENNNASDVKRIDNAIKQSKITRTKEIVELDFQQLKETPEYIRAFEDLEQTSTETLQYLIQEFEKVKQVAAETLDPKDLQEYINVMSQMQSELGSRNPLSAITNAKLELKKATEESTQAEEDYNDAIKKFGNGSQEEIDAHKKLISAKDKQNKATKKLYNSEKVLFDIINNLANGFKELGETIGGDFGKAISSIGDIGITVLSTVMQLKALQVEIQNTSLAITALETASVILAAISAAFKIISSVYNTFFNKEDDSYERAKSSMEGYIEVLDKVIAKEKELMNFYAGQAGEQAYNNSIRLIEKERELAKKHLNEYLNSGASTFSHSKGVEMENAIKESGKSEQIIDSVINALSEIGNSNWTFDDVVDLLFDKRMTGLLNLTTEELEALKKTDVWGYLDSETKGYINTLIECDEKLDDLQQQYKEWLTGLSEEDWHKEFLDGLLDVESTAEDVFNNIAEYIRKAMIQHLVFSKMQNELSKFYDEYVDYMDNTENLTSEERQKWFEDFRDKIQGIIAQGKEEVEGINNMFPFLDDSTRSANSNAFSQMTQDQATKLEGMFTAVQGHTYDIRDYTHEMRDCAIIIQKEISGIHVDTSIIVKLLTGVDNRMTIVDNRLKGFEMRGIKMS